MNKILIPMHKIVTLGVTKQAYFVNIMLTQS